MSDYSCILQSASNEWQKFDYLLEFGQWLYCSEFPLEDAMDQIQWAIDILLNFKINTVEVKKEESGETANKYHSGLLLSVFENKCLKNK